MLTSEATTTTELPTPPPEVIEISSTTRFLRPERKQSNRTSNSSPLSLEIYLVLDTNLHRAGRCRILQSVPIWTSSDEWVWNADHLQLLKSAERRLSRGLLVSYRCFVRHDVLLPTNWNRLVAQANRRLVEKFIYLCHQNPCCSRQMRDASRHRWGQRVGG